MEFNWENFKNRKCVVCCKTEKEAKEFIHECYKHNISWMFSSINETHWKLYEENTYYICETNTLYLSYGNINYNLVKLPVIEYKEDNKMELKEGMIVECRNKNRYLLRKVDDTIIGSSFDGWIKATYDENLCESYYHDKTFDIMKIYKSNAYILEDLFDNNYLICIWKRKEPKKMTLTQISEALGYEVEVIDNE